MSDAVLTAIIMALSGVVGSFVTWFLTKKDKTTKEMEDLKLGVTAILRDKLMHNHGIYKADGYVTYQGKESFEKMYQAYHSLGGNGMINSLHDEVMQLETRKNTESK